RDVLFRSMGNGAVKTTTTLVEGLDKYWQILGVADFDGDSQSDLIWRNAIAGDVAVWLIEGGALKSFSTLMLGLDPLNWQLAGIGDLDNDAKADLIWRSSKSGDVVAWMID